MGCSSPKENSATQEDGFRQIFDGETLDGWGGDSTYWRVEDGITLVGEVTPETILDRNSFIIWQGEMPTDFELKAEYRITANGNSGINYRSEIIENVPFAMKGYQADLDGKNRYTGMNYEERKRTTLASIGEKVVVPPTSNTDSLHSHIQNNQWTASKVVESLGHPDSLKTNINNGAWNDYHIIANGNQLRHYVNGVLMSEVIDRDTVNQRFDGSLGVQVHVGPPMKVEYRNFRIKNLNN
ncbi:MAG: DUF1080 domain-containing protein [Balneolaceae bacterium]|nr:DUF1080 domain-containing protein [Balneolaceae bacterium]